MRPAPVPGDRGQSIARINAVRGEALASPRREPTIGASGRAQCPECLEILVRLVVHASVERPEVATDVLYQTLYACRTHRLLWLYETGGIAGVRLWLGPVPAREGDL